MNRRFTAFLFILLAGAGAMSRADSVRHPAILDRDYGGAYPDAFAAEYDRVRLLVRQAQLEVSSGLGLIQYQDGFHYPLIIRFEDQAPHGLEYAVAYVRLGRTAEGFAQELVINVPAAQASGSDVDQIFTHEMTHAVLNDAVGGDASQRIPVWTQEGLAQYISGEGDARVKALASGLRRSRAALAVMSLDSPPSAAAYPSYYLAIRYLRDVHSVNAVQALVRDLIAGHPITHALAEATGLEDAAFRQAAHDYSVKAFEDLARPGE